MKWMFCLLLSLFISQNAMCADIATTRSNLEKLESQGIKNSTNPQIKELYEKLSKSVADMAELEKGYIDELQKNADAMHEKENSTENKLIGAAGIGATGVGAMQLMSGMAEKSADEDAENQMKAYMATFRCNYGGLSHKGGEVGIELPAGDLSALKQEYLTLAADLKIRKESLDMQPGIESEEILDATTAGLYDDEHIGKTDGQYTSIYKALTDEASEDATEFAEQKEDAKKKVKTGGITAAVGAVGSLAASLIVNKDAPKENSKKIKSEHEQKKRELEKEISNTEEQLNTAIADNEAKIKKYNDLLAQHQNFAKSITESECLEQFKDYTSTIGALAPITDSFADTSTLDIKYDLTKQQADYNECVETAEQKRKIEECESKSQYHKWLEDKCVDNTPATAGTDETTQSETSQSETVQDANAPVVATAQLTDEELRNDPERCPREGNGLKTIDDSYKVGDSCSYGNVTVGRIFKYKEDRKDGKKKGACSCTAIECKEGYEVKNGSCIEKVADNNGICLKKEIPTNDYKQCNTLCKKYATDNKCKFQQAMAVKNPLRCVCNPNSQDIDSIKKQDEERKKNKVLTYYDVCDVDKGKAKEKGKTEVCEENVFKYIQLPAAVAQDIAEEYTTKRLNKDVKCSDKYAEHGNDDWLKCTAYDESTYYTFRFDDLEETDSDQINPSKVIAICAINSVSSTVSASTNVVGNTTYSTSSNNNPNKYMGCYGSCTNGIKETAQKLDMSAQDVGGVCWIRENTEKFFDVCNDYRGKTGGGKEECDENTFAGVQVSFANGVKIVREFMRVKGKSTNGFECDSKYTEASNDDWINCKDNSGTYYTFRFDDLIESSEETAETGTALAICKIHGMQSTINFSPMVGYGILANNNPKKYKGCYTESCDKIKTTANNLGMSYEQHGKVCRIYDKALQRDTQTQSGKKLYAVCKNDKGKSGGTEYCVEGVFNWINVQHMQATALAQEYARVKHGNNIECESSLGSSWNDDYIMCSDGKNFYEFQFDDAKESIDGDGQKSLRVALCEKIYGGFFAPENDYRCINLTETNAKKLAERAKSIFNIDATLENKEVHFSTSLKSVYELKTIDGIDPYKFYSGDIQLQAHGSKIIDFIYEYVTLQLAIGQTESGDLTCSSNPIHAKKTKYNGETKGSQGSSDDVLTCTFRGKQMDFVFDDLSEFSDKLSKGGYQNADCRSVGGSLTGDSCRGVGEMQCKRIIALSKNKGVAAGNIPYWDGNQCLLPAAASATALQENIDMTIMIGGAVVGAALTVATFGAGGAVLGTASMIFFAVENVGATIEIAKSAKIDNQIHDFLYKSAQCKNKNCAKNMLAENLKQMDALASDMTDAQIEGVDYELARLAELLPADDEFYLAIRDNLSATGDSWSSDQVLRAVGVALQLASIATGVIKWLAGKTAKLTKSIAVITKKTKTTTTAVAKTSKTTTAVAQTTNFKSVDDLGDAARKAGATADDATDGANGSKRTSDGAQNKTNNNGDSGTRSATEGATGATGGAKKLNPELENYKSLDNNGKKSMYRKLSQRFHPDKLGDYSEEAQKQAEEIFKYMGEHTAQVSGSTILQLTDAELDELSRMIDKFDELEAAAKRANQAANTASGAKQTTATPKKPTPAEENQNIWDEIKKTTTKADDVADTVKPKSISQIKDELDEVFNTRVSNILSKLDNGNIEFRSEYYPKSKLTDAEWALLNEDLKAKGLKLVDSGDKYQIGATDETIKKAEKIRDAKRAAEEAEKKAAEEAAKKAEEARIKSMQNHENASINVGKGHTYTPKNHVSGTVDTTNKVDDAGRATTKADDVADGARTANATANAAKTTSRATNASADATRTATNATDAARTANNASDAVRQGSINISQADEDLILDAIIKKQSNKLSRTEHIKAIRTMDKYFDAGAADDFARQMRKDLVDAFVQDPRPEITNDGQAFAEFIIEKLGPKYGIPQGTIRVQISPVSGGYASYLDNVLTINPHAFPKKVTLNDRNIQMINLITHEFVHAIDDLAPEYGVIGKKLNAYGDLSGLYVRPGQLMDGAQDMYELIPTERAAHKVSDIVSGATNYGREIGDNPILDELINVLSQ